MELRKRTVPSLWLVNQFRCEYYIKFLCFQTILNVAHFISEACSLMLLIRHFIPHNRRFLLSIICSIYTIHFTFIRACHTIEYTLYVWFCSDLISFLEHFIENCTIWYSSLVVRNHINLIQWTSDDTVSKKREKIVQIHLAACWWLQKCVWL